MARITKAALEQQLADLNLAFEQAHAALMHVSAQRDALVAELETEQRLHHAAREALRTQRVAQGTPCQLPRMPNWQAERLAAMAQAKELAMRFGRSVKVSA